METAERDDSAIGVLAQRAQGGDSKALALLADMLRGSLFSVAYAELGHYDDAQDAVANTLLRLCRHLPNLRSPEKLRSWALHIARNEARRLYKNRCPHSANLPDTLPDIAPADTALLLDIERAVRALPLEQARTITLFYREGLSVREISQHLDRPEGTIKYWLHRGRASLHHTLEGYAPMTTLTPIAAVVSSDLSPTLLASMTGSLKAGGWNQVRHSSVPSPLDQDVQGQVCLAPSLAECQCVVLDEAVTGRSAFEWLLLLRSTDTGRDIPVLLLIEGGRPEAQVRDTVLAAYLAGFDMCLTKPFAPMEFQHFAKRLLPKP